MLYQLTILQSSCITSLPRDKIVSPFFLQYVESWNFIIFCNLQLSYVSLAIRFSNNMRENLNFSLSYLAHKIFFIHNLLTICRSSFFSHHLFDVREIISSQIIVTFILCLIKPFHLVNVVYVWAFGIMDVS